jgi:folate-binding protein YgfZ
MKIQIQNRAILKVSGDDAQSFLQNQFSNDITLIKDNEMQLNAYCTHQGKIIVLFRVFKYQESYFLDFSLDLLEVVQKRLTMFVLMSKVEITNVSDDFMVIAHIDEEATKDTFKLIDNIAFSYELANYKNDDLLIDENLWQETLIKNKIPEVTLVTSEKFVPQMLNLDLDEVNGVNFKKGCYPGQEVVARLHYLGKAKRRLFVFKTTEKNINIGDELFSHQSQSMKKSGIIVSFISGASDTLCLGVLELSQAKETITLNNADGAIMEIL